MEENWEEKLVSFLMFYYLQDNQLRYAPRKPHNEKSTRWRQQSDQNQEKLLLYWFNCLLSKQLNANCELGKIQLEITIIFCYNIDTKLLKLWRISILNTLKMARM